jgi:hypothetical protein
MNTEFKVGDIVKVRDTGDVYSTYYDMFKKLGFIYTKRNSGKNSLGLLGEIFAIEQHPYESVTVAAVNLENGEQILIGVYGIQKVTFKPKYEPITAILNENYNAIVYPDRVEVGCQTFSFDSIKDLFVITKEMERRNRDE